jgi:tetratricopeptide (TPR) repeat protein
MNTKKTIIFTGLSLLLSNAFNSAYSADGAGKTPGDWAGQSSDGLAATLSNAPSSAAYFNQAVTETDGSGAESDGSGAGGGASSSARRWGQHFSKGTDYVQEGEILKAFDSFTAALAIQGISEVSRAACLYALGNVYRLQNNYSEAIAQFSAALAIDEFDERSRAWCLYALGSVYDLQKKYSEAIAQFSEALAIDEFDGKDRACCIYKLGFAYSAQGNLPQAEAYALYGLGFVSLNTGEFGKAISCFKFASERMPMEIRRELEGPLGIKLLMHAVDTESQENARFLLANGVAINAKDNNGKTALMRTKSVRMREFLVDKGACVDAVDNKRMTALMGAAVKLKDYELEQLNARATQFKKIYGE